MGKGVIGRPDGRTTVLAGGGELGVERRMFFFCGGVAYLDEVAEDQTGLWADAPQEVDSVVVRPGVDGVVVACVRDASLGLAVLAE